MIIQPRSSPLSISLFDSSASPCVTCLCPRLGLSFALLLQLFAALGTFDQVQKLWTTGKSSLHSHFAKLDEFLRDNAEPSWYPKLSACHPLQPDRGRVWLSRASTTLREMFRQSTTQRYEQAFCLRTNSLTSRSVVAVFYWDSKEGATSAKAHRAS